MTQGVITRWYKYYLVITPSVIVVLAHTIGCWFCIICIGNMWWWDSVRFSEIQIQWDSVRFKHINCSSHFVFNYRGFNLNFLKLAQILIDGDIYSNLSPAQNDYRSPCGWPKEMKVFKPKAFDLRILILMLLVIQRYKTYFSMQFNLLAKT